MAKEFLFSGIGFTCILSKITEWPLALNLTFLLESFF